MLRMIEIYKDIPSYEGIYQVSNLGNVKSLNYRLTNKEKVLKVNKDTVGYYCVGLYKDKTRKLCRIHQLVSLVFLNHKANGMVLVVDHINNIKTDNRLENLQIITNRENSSKDKKGGTSKYVGVYWNKDAKKWNSRIRINGKQENLGYFKSEYNAYLAYQNIKNSL